MTPPVRMPRSLIWPLLALQVVVEGVGDIDRGRRRRTVSHQLQLGGMDRAVAGEGLPVEVTWAVISASMEIPWLFWTTPAATGSKCFTLMLAPRGVSEASFSFTGPALPLTSSEPPPGRAGREHEGKSLGKRELLHRKIQLAVDKRRPGGRQVGDDGGAVLDFHLAYGEVGQSALLLRVLRAAGGGASDVGEVPHPCAL